MLNCGAANGWRQSMRATEWLVSCWCNATGERCSERRQPRRLKRHLPTCAPATFPAGTPAFPPAHDPPCLYKWNETIGPLEDRPGREGTWVYINTDGLGLIEYIHWCDNLELEPILAVWDGSYLSGPVANRTRSTPAWLGALPEGSKQLIS